jgi:very-short-patch-repair endonuclease
MSELTRHQVATNVRVGYLETVRSGVYRVGGAPDTWEQALLAACLGAGARSVASFRAAARLWALERFTDDDVLEITTPSRQRARMQGVVVHDSTRMKEHHVTRRTGIPVTTPARTLCDLTACCNIWQVERAVDESLRRRITTLEKLTTVFLDLAHKGRRRSTIMRSILEDRVPGFDPGESPQEAKLVRWLQSGDVPTPVQQHGVRVGNRNYRLDLAYPLQKIGIEYDGWDAHRSRGSFDRDRARDNDLQAAGWLMLHFTSRSKRTEVIARVRQALKTSSM